MSCNAFPQPLFSHDGASFVRAIAPGPTARPFRLFPMDRTRASANGGSGRGFQLELGPQRPAQAHFLQALLRGEQHTTEQDTRQGPSSARRSHPPSLTSLLRGRAPDPIVAVSQGAHQSGDFRDKEVFNTQPTSTESTTIDGTSPGK